MREILNLDSKTKESIILLQIGTFLEYFDLMLFVHMAVVLNELFFPKSDPFTTSLITAFSFCSTFILKPVGALLFGYIGDKIGRKHTVVITTMLMAISCLIMANAPTYAQIGITASWIITICRGLQGMSSIGESVGAELYTAEMIKPPLRYRAVALIGLAGVIGMVVSLIVARMVLSIGISWRIIFWIGALIALVGSMARITLRESPEFSDAKRKRQNAIRNSEQNGLENVVKLLSSTNKYLDEKVCKKTSLAYFMVFCGWPFCFYFSYVHCGGILKSQFDYTKEAVINQNLIVSLVNLVGLFSFVWLTKKIHPLIILKWKVLIYIPFICSVPWLLYKAESASSILVIQCMSVVFGNSTIPAKAVFLMHFPIFKRFRYASFITAISHVLLYILTSFGLVYAVYYFGHFGVLFISLPTTLSFLFGVLYFTKLEKEIGSYPSKGEWQVR